MIHYRTGDIFKCSADALVNPVNLEGVSGKGLALDFALHYPLAQNRYIAACSNGSLHMGTVLAVKAKDNLNGRDRLIVYAPTKKLWRFPSRADYIESTLAAIAAAFPTWGISSIALPALGCGLGGLNFEFTVKPLIEISLGHLNGRVEVFLPA